MLYTPAIDTSPTASPPQVTILVLNWNGWQDTCKCVVSLRALDTERLGIVVVDNGSTDGSVQELQTCLPGLELLQLDENYGFAGGMNRGIEHALAQGAELILLLNNDLVAAPDLVKRLVEVARARPEVGLFGCELRSQAAPGGPAYAITGMNWMRGEARVEHLPAGEFPPLPVELVSGAALMARRELVERAGLLDERYFLYFEDLEWGLRARQAGFGAVIVRGAVVWHQAAASTLGRREAPRPTAYYYLTRNNLLFMRQHASPPAQIAFVPFFLGRTMLLMLRVLAGAVLGGKPRAGVRLWALVLGMVDGWRGVWGKTRFAP